MCTLESSVEELASGVIDERILNNPRREGVDFSNLGSWVSVNCRVGSALVSGPGRRRRFYFIERSAFEELG
jgi:hypothetical protein